VFLLPQLFGFKDKNVPIVMAYLNSTPPNSMLNFILKCFNTKFVIM